MNITIGQISAIIVFLVAFIGGIVQLIKYLQKALKMVLKEEFESVNNKIDDLSSKMVENTLNQDKNFLARSFDDLDNNRKVSETTIERIHECMEEYTRYGGNSYIHSRYEKLKKEGKL